jgi:hypothetical protein
MKTIYGDWCDKHTEVMAAQSEPFVFINSNGSGYKGELSELFDMLDKYPLDPDVERFGDFIDTMPCEGVVNPNWTHYNGADHWIDGPRIFQSETYYFHGNFYNYSHVFSIYTNDIDIINKLTAAILRNKARQDYLSAKAA